MNKNNKILFACDLDNTLLHSHRIKKDGDICVEILDGKKQSYITPQVQELIYNIIESENISLVPVTTRSEEQYKRIQWAENCTPKYALVCNGAILLKNNTIEPKWHEESLHMIESYIKELEQLCQKYSIYECFKTVRIVDNMFLFAYCNENEDIESIAEKCSADTELDVQYSGRKLYFFPPFASKGSSVKRFMKYIKFDKIISAGDSIIDCSMLEIADKSYIPDTYLAEKLKTTSFEVCENGVPFSEFILKSVLEYCTT